MSVATSVKTKGFASSLRLFLLVVGPGIVVMLADTDAGSVITAAQSGAQWNYQLLLLQFALMPVLYIVQELTVRLGSVEGQGHAALILRHFGRAWAWVSVSTLMLACLGALLTEFSGLAGVGALYGVAPSISLGIVTVGLIVMALTGSYLTVERIAIAVGAFELVFIVVAWLAHPSVAEMARQSIDIPIANPKYLYLVSANIGAVIMPWMVFYQQSAVVEKGIGPSNLRAARWDTVAGAIVTQLIMAAILVAAASALHGRGGAVSLDTVQEVAAVLTKTLGATAGRLLFSLGVSGAAIVATIVVTLTAARTLGEVLGYKHSLESDPREAPWFYLVYSLALIISAGVVLSGINLVSLSVGVQVMNALLLPIVLGFLFLLARRLPKAYQLRGAYALIVAIIMILTAGLGVYSGVAGLWN